MNDGSSGTGVALHRAASGKREFPVLARIGQLQGLRTFYPVELGGKSGACAPSIPACRDLTAAAASG
jgi:hypothetical protein